MELLDQLLRFLQDGIAWIVRFIQLIWDWSVQQIDSVPWNSLGALPLWKQILLVAVAAGVVYLLYRAGKELFEAGADTLTAIAKLLTAFVKTLVPILLSGIVATAGAWVINNVNF